ncbi:MAG: LamG domain-containing protein, partial [Planctomycetaceae bacterium]
ICVAPEVNRASHFAGGRMRTSLSGMTDRYTVLLRFWNGMPLTARPVAGWLFSRGHDHGLSLGSEHLGIGGTEASGKLLFAQKAPGDQLQTVAGRTAVERWTWHSLAYVRDGQQIRVYLDDHSQPEIETTAEPRSGDSVPWFFGGRSDNQDNWEGRLDEIAVFDRALTSDELKLVQHAAGADE